MSTGVRGSGALRGAWAFASAVGFGLGAGAGAMLVAQGRTPPDSGGPATSGGRSEAGRAAASAPAGSQPSRDIALRTLTARSVRITDDDGNVVLELSGDELGGLVESRKPDGTALDQFPSLAIRGTKPPEPEVIITPAAPPASGGSPAEVPKAPAKPAQAWENPANWGKVYRYMSKAAVSELMGEPERVQRTSSGERWYYGDGYLYFDTGNRLSYWREPGQTD